MATRLAEIRFLCIAPSPYTNRHDALRAGAGIRNCVNRLIAGRDLPLKTSLYDVAKVVESPEKARSLLRNATALVIGSSAWAQGSSWLVRRFFELAGEEYLGGVAATAWATAGGTHTGGEVVIQDILRSLMGMGAQVFTLGQKLMAFTMDEREFRPGEFTLLDCWYMDQFARNIALVALAKNDRVRAAQLSAELGVSTQFYSYLPRDQAVLERDYGELRAFLNAAADPGSAARRQLQRSCESEAG